MISQPIFICNNCQERCITDNCCSVAVTNSTKEETEMDFYCPFEKTNVHYVEIIRLNILGDMLHVVPRVRSPFLLTSLR